MYKICKTEKSVVRQKEFGETMLKLLEKKDGEDITISSLCNEMGVPRRAFYRYFDGIEDIGSFIIDNTLKEAFLYLQGKLDIVAFFQYWYEHRKNIEFLLRYGIDGALFTRIFFLRVEKKEEIEMNKQAMWDAYHISGLFGILFTWVHSGMKQTPEEMAVIYEEIIRETSKIAQLVE